MLILIPLVGVKCTHCVYVPVLQMSHAMQVKPADSEGKAGVSPTVHVWHCVPYCTCVALCPLLYMCGTVSMRCYV